MPQSPYYVSKNQSNALAPLVLDANGKSLLAAGSLSSSLNVTALALVKVGVGRVAKVVVLTAGSAPGKISDVATTGGVAAANLIFNIPNTVGIYELDFPIALGLVVTPGTGQVLSISYV
jgi:hypothetical protein